MTALAIGPIRASQSCLSFFRISAETNSGVSFFPWYSLNHALLPICRLMASMTFSGGSTATRCGLGPTTTCPDSPSSTIEGVVVLSSALGIEMGRPSGSNCARAENVVPKSMPIV